MRATRIHVCLQQAIATARTAPPQAVPPISHPTVFAASTTPITYVKAVPSETVVLNTGIVVQQATSVVLGANLHLAPVPRPLPHP